MQLFPERSDRQPAQARFWVRSEEDGIVPTEVIKETPEAVEERLERDFPIYRAFQVGKRVVAGLIGGGSEV